jgi:hypothetical protein
MPGESFLETSLAVAILGIGGIARRGGKWGKPCQDGWNWFAELFEDGGIESRQFV